MSDDIKLRLLRMRPSGTIRLLKPACNGSAQLSYFIYSCTVRTQLHRRTTARRHHARADLRPNVLCIRSTMSNSQRTSEGAKPPYSFSIFLLSREVKKLVEPNGIEPMTSCLQSRRSPS
jgi:hypothetical protein